MRKIYILVVTLFMLTACDKKEVTPLDFDVTVDRTTVNKGDTVTFSVRGNPDQLTFYSDEQGFQYDNKDRTRLNGVPGLRFTSYRQYGYQTNSLSIFISKDFSGDYTKGGIEAATWEDITSRATLSEGLDNTPSGLIDLSDFSSKGSPVIYLAFRYTGTGGTTQRAWTIKNLVITNKLEDGSEYPVTTISDAGWAWIRLNPSTSQQRWQITETQLQFVGGNETYGSNLGWVITKALDLTKVLPDKGIALKNMTTRVDTYQYVYKQEGDYNPVFVASNENIYGVSSGFKRIHIRVEP